MSVKQYDTEATAEELLKDMCKLIPLVSRYSVYGKPEGDFDLVIFSQLWGTTMGGFAQDGYFGESAMTSQRTYVFISSGSRQALVFFGTRFAYSCDASDSVFKADLKARNLAGAFEHGKYKDFYF